MSESLGFLWYFKVKYSVDEPTVSTSFKEKTEEKIVTNEGEKDEIIAKLKGNFQNISVLIFCFN